MPAPRLRDLAVSAAIRGLDGIKDVADLEYKIVRPILKAIDNPQQLAEIEANSPHIAGESEELWIHFIQRDILNWKSKIVRPRDPRSWSKVYHKLMRNEKREQVEQEKSLEAAMQASMQKIVDNRTQFVQKVMPRSYREFVREEGRSVMRGSTPAVRPTPALKNASAGKDILAAIRKQSVNEARQKGIARSQYERQVIPSAQDQITAMPGHLAEALRKPTRTVTNLPTKPLAPITSQARPIRSTTTSRVFSKNTALGRTDRLLEQAIHDQKLRKEANDKRRLTSAGSPNSTSPSSPSQSSEKAMPRVRSTRSSPQRTPLPGSAPTTTPAPSSAAEQVSPPPASHVLVQGRNPTPTPEGQPITTGMNTSPKTGTKRPAETSAPQPAPKRRPPPSIFMPQRRKA